MAHAAAVAAAAAGPEELPYRVPKTVPKWVVGFPEWLRAHKQVTDPNVASMDATWRQYQLAHWPEFHGMGRKPKPRKRKADEAELPDTDTLDTAVPKEKVPPKFRHKLRQRLQSLRNIADERALPEVLQIVQELDELLDKAG